MSESEKRMARILARAAQMQQAGEDDDRLGIMLGRARILTTIANAEDSFERALKSLKLPRDRTPGEHTDRVLTDGSSDS